MIIYAKIIINLLYNIEFYYFFIVKVENSYFRGIRSPIFDGKISILETRKSPPFAVLG